MSSLPSVVSDDPVGGLVLLVPGGHPTHHHHPLLPGDALFPPTLFLNPPSSLQQDTSPIPCLPLSSTFSTYHTHTPPWNIQWGTGAALGSIQPKKSVSYFGLVLRTPSRQRKTIENTLVYHLCFWIDLWEMEVEAKVVPVPPGNLAVEWIQFVELPKLAHTQCRRQSQHCLFFVFMKKVAAAFKSSQRGRSKLFAKIEEREDHQGNKQRLRGGGL